MALLLLGACSAPAVSTTAPVSPTVTAPISTTTAVSSDTAAPSTTVTTTASDFRYSIEAVTAQHLGVSWRQGCPVAPEGLSRLTMPHHGYDGELREGVLIVATEWAEEVASVFSVLFGAAFPIERMEPVTAYDADDDASMAANNTSAFNCRPVAGTSRWSEHAYGWAVDINPLVNPYVRGDQVEPPGGRPYVDRDPTTPGLIVDGDVVVAAFAAIGWEWGGHWESVKDYQHFSLTGR